MEQSKNSGFNSKLGVILAAAGSAIGLGNIWKFPYEAGQNGGGAFLLVYLLCVILFGMPLQDKDLVPYSQKRYKQWLRPLFVFTLRWIVPIAIVLIFLNGLGIFNL